MNREAATGREARPDDGMAECEQGSVAERLGARLRCRHIPVAPVTRINLDLRFSFLTHIADRL